MIHDKFGVVCTCSCHTFGWTGFAHCFTGPCCEFHDKWYMREDGTLDEEAFGVLCEEAGRVGIYLPSNMWEPLPEFTKFVFPVIKNVGGLVGTKPDGFWGRIKWRLSGLIARLGFGRPKPFPSLRADDIVSANPVFGVKSVLFKEESMDDG